MSSPGSEGRVVPDHDPCHNTNDNNTNNNNNSNNKTTNNKTTNDNDNDNKTCPWPGRASPGCLGHFGEPAGGVCCVR